VNYDNSLVVTITVTCYSWPPSSGDHLFACDAIYRTPQFPTEKQPDNSIYVNFVNLLRMIKKTIWTNKQRTPGLGSGTHKTSVSVLNEIFL